MPLEKFSGSDVPTLLARAQEKLGKDVVLHSVRRFTSTKGSGFEVIVGDATSIPRRPSPARQPMFPSAWTRMSPFSPLDPPRLDDRPTVMALVGPTGAGKTTTIAKLANHPDIFRKYSVGFLCLDTYRIGAVEQLQIYAELSSIPLEVVYEDRELDNALRRLRGCDVVLIDTAGRGPDGAADLNETFSQLERIRPSEIHLAIPVGLQTKLARHIIREHLSRGVTHLLAAKHDEFPEDRSVFELAAEYRLPLRWITNGQEVPADIRSAESVRVPASGGTRAHGNGDLLEVA